MMVPNSEEGNNSRNLRASSSKNNKSSNKPAPGAVKDTEEYRKLRERNNEAVKKSRTRTKLRTQATLEKVEKLRHENSKLEERIEGLKKELDLLKELFLSHTGTKSMKRLAEVDLEILLAEAAPNNKRKKGASTYTGRSREQIESEVQALLGEEEDSDEAQPSTSQSDQADHSSNSLLTQNNSTTVDTVPEESFQAAVDESMTISESFAIVDDNSDHHSLWAENSDSVVVTITNDGQSLVSSDIQQNLHAIIEGEILMLE